MRCSHGVPARELNDRLLDVARNANLNSNILVGLTRGHAAVRFARLGFNLINLTSLFSKDGKDG